MLIAAADVGSVSNRKFAWFAADGGGKRRSGELNHEDPAGLAECVRTALRAGEAVALGFECPLALPVHDNAQLLGGQRPGEGRHTWSSFAGPMALASGIVQLSWVLHELPRTVTTVRPSRWPNAAQLLLWEAFVAGRFKPVPQSGQTAHLADAAAAVRGFRQLPRPTPEEGRVKVGTTKVVNLAATAALTSGLDIAVDELRASILIVDGEPVESGPGNNPVDAG